ncbi:MAG TPA: hypothetical protein VFP68_03875, partial [Burkholderiaceae bacterium]|nr:hypothetical protein [Burkholderiaceae bacterium]
MTETSASSRVSVRMPSIAALIGGVVLLASLGAAASWIRQFAADSRTVPVAEHQMALAPNETLLPPARTEARLQESEATQGGVSAPSPTTEQAAARPMPTTPDPL